MNKHRENLLKLIKMMKAIHEEIITDNKSRGMIESESERYIYIERLISIRELTKMFIEELNSEYLQYSEGDEIVRYIEDMIKWLQSAYDFTIEHNAGSNGVESLKICNQTLNDYEKVYNEAKAIYRDKDTSEQYIHHFSFGKQVLKENQPITINVTFTDDKKENGITIEKLEKVIMNSIKENNQKRFR